MAQTIKLRRSATSGAQPTTSQLELGELALNTYDGKVYMKKSVGGTESIVEVSGGSGASGTMYTDEFSGDGNTAGFTLSVAPVSEDDLIVFIDGVYQNLNSYSISGTTLTFDTAPDNGTTVIVHHIQGGILGTAPVINTMTGDGSDTTLTLSVAPSSENQTFVTFDGVVQHKDTYSVSGTTLTFSEAVPNGVTVECVTFRNVQVATFEDADGDTKIQVEESADEDIIRFDVAGTEVLQLTSDGLVLSSTDVEANEFIGDLRGAVLFKAQAGENVTKGDVVYISGISGNTTVVSKADADDASKMPAFGIVAATTTSGQPVDIYTQGILGDLDTSSYSEGDELFVSTTAGGLTNTAPTGETALLQKIAKVTRSNALSGSIFITGAGRTNAVPNLDEDQFFLGNASNQAVATDFSDSVESYLDGGTSTPTFASATVSGDLTVDTNTLYVDSSNNEVGIGTTDPKSLLDVGGAETSANVGDGNLVVKTTATNNSAIVIQEASGAEQFALGVNSNGDFVVTDSGSTVPFFIGDQTGYVGIGISSPSFKLDVQYSDGDALARFKDSDSTHDGIRIGGDTNGGYIGNASGFTSETIYFQNSANALRFYTNATERMRINSLGNVGIGTTSPDATLDAVGSINVAGQFTSTATSKSNNTYTLMVDSSAHTSNLSSAGAMSVDVNSGRAFTIDGLGKVGIGTTSPQSRLDIGTSSSSGGGISFGTTLSEIRRSGTNGDTLHTSHWGNVAVLIDSDNNDTSTRAFKVMEGSTDSATANELFRVRSDGRVGIGTTNPSTKLDVAGDITLSATNGKIYLPQTPSTFNWLGDPIEQTGIVIDGTNDGSSERISFFTDNSERMRISSNGGVVIGDTSIPQYTNLKVYEEHFGGMVNIGHSNTGGTFPKVSAIGMGSDAVSFTHSTNNGGVPLSGSAQIAAIQTASGGAPTEMAFYTTSGGSVQERMRITSSGSVLIGTTTDVAESQLNGALKLGNGVNIGIGLKRIAVASSATTVFDVSDFAPSDSTGDGLFMFSIVRTGGSYGTRFVGILGVDNASIAIVEVLESLGFTITVSGMNLQAAVGGATVSCVATLQPLAIGE